jgi:hypothetical protein
VLNLTRFENLFEVNFSSLGAWEKVDRPFFILDFQVLVIANQVSLFCQLKNVFNLAYGAEDLAGGNVEFLIFGDACFLNLLDDASLADAVATVQNAR